MLRNSLSKAAPRELSPWKLAVLLPLWVLAGFVIAQLVIASLFLGLKYLGVPFAMINPAILDAVAAACAYGLSLVVVLGMPWWLLRQRTTKRDLGVNRWLSWADIGLAPAGFVVYFLASALTVYLATLVIPGFDLEQAQDVGFRNISQSYELLLAFVTLVVAAPLAEELLFRGYLYGKLKKAVPIWVAMLITSVLFGFVHGQLNVAIDVFVLSMVMCGLREITGSIWAGTLLHALKNAVAFYILFVNPSLF